MTRWLWYILSVSRYTIFCLFVNFLTKEKFCQIFLMKNENKLVSISLHKADTHHLLKNDCKARNYQVNDWTFQPANQNTSICWIMSMCNVALQLIAAYYIHNERPLWWHILCDIENLVKLSKIMPFRRKYFNPVSGSQKGKYFILVCSEGPCNGGSHSWGSCQPYPPWLRAPSPSLP